ncbi:aldose 1-epimerase family protein [Kozakia baliensis]|uniref:aldose 1-epimerase family protein n=1 Tax=Kozakia baliensis TaxID=153496 RepID=UPI00345BFD24
MAEDSHSFGNQFYTAIVTAQGAELCSLRDKTGQELMWTGKAWPRHSPVLFPNVGRIRDNRVEIDGLAYTLTQHGFARDRKFKWIERSATGCSLILEDDPTSRANFPYAFALTLTYTIDNEGLHLTYGLHNPDDRRVLHASVGAHPAFVWPLREGIAKTDHVLEFSQPEPAPIRRLHEGLMKTERFPSPVEGKILPLREELFEADALIFESPVSRAVTFRAKDGPALRFTWSGFSQLGVWMKPGSDFLCIEPWAGYASPEDFEGPFEQKPGLIHLQPGGRWTAGWSVQLLAA